MQGPSYIDLAKTLANEHLDHTGHDSRPPVAAKAKPGRGIRERVGHP